MNVGNYFLGMIFLQKLNHIRHNTDAVADGDDLGRGTSKFLDIYNQKGGTKTDINERNSEIKVNRYSSGNPYYVTSERGGNARPLANV